MRKEIKVNFIHINFPENIKVVGCAYGFEAICIEPDCENCKRSSKSDYPDHARASARES